jgi:hypothetical protein
VSLHFTLECKHEHAENDGADRENDLCDAGSGACDGGSGLHLRDWRLRLHFGASERARGQIRVLGARRLGRDRLDALSGGRERLRLNGRESNGRSDGGDFHERNAALDTVGLELNVALANVASHAHTVAAAVLGALWWRLRRRGRRTRRGRGGGGRADLLLDGEPRLDDVHLARVVRDGGEPVDARQVVALGQAIQLNVRLLADDHRIDLDVKGRRVLDADDVVREVPAAVGELELAELRLVKLVVKVEHDVRVVRDLERVARELALEEALVVHVEEQHAVLLHLAVVELKRNRRGRRQRRLRLGIGVRRGVDRAHVEEVGVVELEQLARAGPVPARLHVNAKVGSARRVARRAKVEPARAANPHVAERVLGVAQTLGEVDARHLVARAGQARRRLVLLNKRIDLELKERALKVRVHDAVGVVDPLVDVRVLLVNHLVRRRQSGSAGRVPVGAEARARHEEVRARQIGQRRLLVLHVVLDGQKKTNLAELNNKTIRSRRRRVGLSYEKKKKKKKVKIRFFFFFFFFFFCDLYGRTIGRFRRANKRKHPH